MDDIESGKEPPLRMGNVLHSRSSRRTSAGIFGYLLVSVYPATVGLAGFGHFPGDRFAGLWGNRKIGLR